MLTHLIRNTRLLLLGIIFAFLPSSIWADNQSVDKLDVKVVVFTHISKQALNSQQWTPLLQKPNHLDHAIQIQKQLSKEDSKFSNQANPSQLNVDLEQSNTNPNYQARSTDLDVFANLKRRIKENGYRVIIMQHWVQPKRQNGQWVHVFGGHAFDQNGKILWDLQDNPDYQQATYWQIDGILQLNHYQHYQVKADFYLTTHDSHLGVSGYNQLAIPLKSYELDQKHATHLGKWLYFDHPLYGILIKVSSNQ